MMKTANDVEKFYGEIRKFLKNKKPRDDHHTERFQRESLTRGSNERHMGWEKEMRKEAHSYNSVKNINSKSQIAY